ncbi:unnamed protein product [Lota lota]
MGRVVRLFRQPRLLSRAGCESVWARAIGARPAERTFIVSALEMLPVKQAGGGTAPAREEEEARSEAWAARRGGVGAVCGGGGADGGWRGAEGPTPKTPGRGK